MKGQIDSSISRLKLLSRPVPPNSANTFHTSFSKLDQFLRLQLDHLAALPHIHWIQLVARHPDDPDQRHIVEATQLSFPHSSEIYQYLQSEEWLEDSVAPNTLKPIPSNVIGAGFYSCLLPQSNSYDQYLLLAVDGPLSHQSRQLIRRTVDSIADSIHLHHQYQQQSQKIKFLEESLQRIGHQLRHPLGLISLYAHTLSQALPQGALAKQAAVIEKSAHRLSQTLTELMNCAKSQPLKLSSQDLPGLIQSVLADYQGWIDEKNLEIVCSNQPLWLMVDPVHLRQAISNLLSNAIHFSPRCTDIHIHWQVKNSQAILTVTDHGPGISASELQKIFNPFYTNRSGGTGLGLSITRKVVRDHGGQLFAENEPGKGAKFTIKLPIELSSVKHLKETTAC